MSRRIIAVLLTLLGALIVIIGTSRPWATVSVTGLPSLNDISVSGRRAAPAGLPVALAAAAGAFVLAISGRVVRYLVGAGLALAGAALAVNGGQAGHSRSGVIHKALQDSLGIVNHSGTANDSLVGSASANQNSLYLIYVLGALVMLLAGVYTLVTARSWPVTGRRFERQNSADPDAVDAGAGADGGESVASASAEAGARRSLARASSRTAASNASADAWDALSRGEDPTSSGDDPT
jgi:hypothetical protein